MRSPHLFFVAALLSALAAPGLTPPVFCAEPAEAKDKQPAALEYRTWTSADGAKKQEAAFLKMEDGLVFVQRKDGSVGKIPIGALSPADQLFVGQETARRRAKEKHDDLFSDADDTIGPPDEVPQPDIVPREGETKEAFAKRYADHLAKQKKLDGVADGIGLLADRLEAKGRELDRKRSRPNPDVLGVTLSGDLHRLNDQCRAAMDKLLSSFRREEASAAQTGKSAAVPSEVISTQTRMLEEAMREADGDLRSLNTELVSEFRKRITEDSTPAEVDSALADTRRKYKEACDAAAVAFQEKKAAAVSVLEAEGRATTEARKHCLAEIASRCDVLQKAFEEHASPLEDDARLRGLKPLADPTQWKAALSKETDEFSKRCSSLKTQLKEARKSLARDSETGFPSDPSPARIIAFRDDQISKFQQHVDGLCSQVLATRNFAVERLADLHRDKQAEEASARGSVVSAAGKETDAAGASPALQPAEQSRDSKGQAISRPSGPAQLPPGNAEDIAVAVLVGETSDHYKEFGYKGVTLGTTLDQINKETPLVTTPEMNGSPAVFEKKDDTGESFVFDNTDRLVAYGRRYEGGAEDYLEQLIELFGKTSKERIRERDQSPANGRSKVTYTTIDYTFPKVLVRVVFDEQSLPQGVRNLTHVFVVDRKWAEDLLKRSAINRLEAVRWLRAAADLSRAGIYDPDRVPPLKGVRMESEKGGAYRGVKCIDTAREEELKPRWGETATTLATCAGLEEAVPSRQPVAYLNCFRYSGTRLGAVVKVLESPEAAGGLQFSDIYEPIQRTPIMSDWLWRLNQVLMEHYFPPVDGEVKLVRQSDGREIASWIEWTTRDKDDATWKVSCGDRLLMRVEFLGGKKKL